MTVAVSLCVDIIRSCELKCEKLWTRQEHAPVVVVLARGGSSLRATVGFVGTESGNYLARLVGKMFPL